MVVNGVTFSSHTKQLSEQESEKLTDKVGKQLLNCSFLAKVAKFLSTSQFIRTKAVWLINQGGITQNWIEMAFGIVISPSTDGKQMHFCGQRKMIGVTALSNWHQFVHTESPTFSWRMSKMSEKEQLMAVAPEQKRATIAHTENCQKNKQSTVPVCVSFVTSALTVNAWTCGCWTIERQKNAANWSNDMLRSGSQQLHKEEKLGCGGDVPFSYRKPQSDTLVKVSFCCGEFACAACFCHSNPTSLHTKPERPDRISMTLL